MPTSDECGVFVQSVNRGHGIAQIGKRVCSYGPYKHSKKYNVLMAITGEDGTPAVPAGQWVEMWSSGGTTVKIFLNFIDQIIDSIGQGTPA